MGLLKLSEESSITTPAAGYVTAYPSATTSRWASMDESGNITTYPYRLQSASVAAVAGAYAADTYLAGSGITIPSAGDWSVGQTYKCAFDMTKTAAGTATFIAIVRMGTLGTVGDAAILTLTFGAGTAAIDTGIFELWATFRTVGSGTSAVIAGMIECRHALAATGLVSTGASGLGLITGTSAGFNSTTQTVIGLSINGGASFSGTNTLVQASLGK